MNLLAKREDRTLELRLTNPEQREQSKILHRLRLLSIAGYSLVECTDMISRKDRADRPRFVSKRILSRMEDSSVKRLSDSSSDFLKTCGALSHIVYLYAYDEVLKLEGRESLEGILRETYRRCLHLLDQLGVTPSQGLKQARGVQTITQTYRYCSESLRLSSEEIRDVLFRVGYDSEIDPFVRGAVCGAQWKLTYGR
ncbi:hypothetical protein LEP1GSC168_0832 [Leptospira santarosai str. HAI134]|nr:hypothetical protein LEP1GSC168_0832 [Leptospira santarosai str. HAI134]